jgi:ATP phosphoribosyltransferase
VVKKEKLHQAIRELRDIGGSGVVVSPVNFIFEEQPKEILNMMNALETPYEDL